MMAGHQAVLHSLKSKMNVFSFTSASQVHRVGVPISFDRFAGSTKQHPQAHSFLGDVKTSFLWGAGRP
jgi:hypothetical protein